VIAEHHFYVNGKRVTRAHAYAHWLSSKQFRDAKNNGRKNVWRIVTRGDELGRHNPNHEVELLLAAGIELR